MVMSRLDRRSTVDHGLDVDDESLVELACRGDDRALAQLLHRYRRFARAKARSYFLIGGDREDIVQEGMIGLYKAIRDFDAKHGASFRSFAELCITRQILTAIKTATRQKHGPLNTSVPYERPPDDEYGRGYGVAGALATEDQDDPLRILVASQEMSELQTAFDELLSDLEADVLQLYVDGRSYQEIADRLGRHVKSIDNALQRIKRKIEGHLEGRAAPTG